MLPKIDINILNSASPTLNIESLSLLESTEARNILAENSYRKHIKNYVLNLARNLNFEDLNTDLFSLVNLMKRAKELLAAKEDQQEVDKIVKAKLAKASAQTAHRTEALALSLRLPFGKEAIL